MYERTLAAVDQGREIGIWEKAVEVEERVWNQIIIEWNRDGSQNTQGDGSQNTQGDGSQNTQGDGSQNVLGIIEEKAGNTERI